MSDAPLRKLILTPRLVLREIRMRDLPPFHELVRSEDVMKYWYTYLESRVLTFPLTNLFWV